MNTVAAFNVLVVALALVVMGGALSQYPVGGPWCGHPGGLITPADFDGDGFDDLLCYEIQGYHWARYAALFRQDEYLTNYLPNWCLSLGNRRYIGDFNGDNRDDMLCHDRAGTMWITLADSTGIFPVNSWSKALGWCLGTNEQLHVGDFNGDGRADVLCHDTSSGYKRVSISANGTFFEHGSNWELGMKWCNHTGSELHIGDFNGDGRDDILCHDKVGQKWIAISQGAGSSFTGFAQSYYRAMDWCSNAAILKVGYFNNDRLADLVCHSSDGSTWTAINHPTARFDGPTSPPVSFCIGDVKRFLVGSFFNQATDQIMCTVGSQWAITSDFF